MEIIGKKVIPSKRETVWHALNDPVILKLCLPGCESVEKIGTDEFKVIIKTAIGPLRARFQGSLKMTEVNAPESCVMLFEGQGGAVGFGKGSSSVILRAVDGGTELSYEAKAQVGGKLAQVGSRLIDSVAKKMTDDFFKAFQNQLNPPPSTPSTAVVSQSPNASQSSGVLATQEHAVAAASAVSTHGLERAQSNEPMVPAWWLAPAAVLGAFLAIAGARFIH
jgi:hypothetical protein